MKVRARSNAHHKEKKSNAFESANAPYEGRELALNALKNIIFP